ncbi:hemerythrin domain-containing protein [Natronosporangium hydrolyticum]|uniref:Hemerythrin domain-containing protein n=1 Tax=Natronosporangium hydrolyticum TaxID=2811111 RepID=A0A895YG50_9ACTN|nr:hemerythrin domain-containing protein [Natronosporangium hydrolyticum]QSB16797.1 hemerythrin domain-containing protein [Natronosporangium hydrolyticum]
MTARNPMSTEDGAADLPDHVLSFGLLHVAMRRDARRLVNVAAALSPGVTRWWEVVRTVIDWHHRSEDTVLWPELRRRIPGFTAQEARMHGDHEELERSMDEVSASLNSGRDADTHAAVALRFESVLREHLRTEESLVLPIFTDTLSRSDYLGIERRVLATAPLPVLSVLQPWMSDSVDRRTAGRMAAAVPPPVRLISRTILRRRYQRLAAPVLMTQPS